jgi:mRNA-degrading endonuclease toxin of MazEF toxin-antitoxin module
MYKKYDEWNKIKKQTHNLKKKVYFKQRDIFFIRIGENIGYEQSGKGEDFLRPVVVLKKFNNDFFMGVPLTSTQKSGKYYFEFEFSSEKKSYAILSQMRAFDSKRIKHKIGMIHKEDFEILQEKIGKLYLDMLAPPKDGDDPEGICRSIIT